MSDSLQMLLLNGFMIYPSNGKFVVKKESVPESCYSLEIKEFNTYGEAFDYAIEILHKPRKQVWGVMLRYYRDWETQQPLTPLVMQVKSFALCIKHGTLQDTTSLLRL